MSLSVKICRPIMYTA